MKKILVLIILVLLGACVGSNKSSAQQNPRERVSIDFDWKFSLGDIENASQEQFNDADWRHLDVPHDWSIEGEYNENNPAGIAGAYLPTGIGWYRKNIEIENLEKDDKYFVEFDGVYMNSDVYINGNHLGKRPYGYISFSYDLTPYLKEGTNKLAVRVDNSKSPSGRWYTGSGIYRHVWLTKTSTIYIPQWGTAITTSNISDSSADIKINGDIKNDAKKDQVVDVISIIYDATNIAIDSTKSTVQINKDGSFEQSITVNNPKLWSPDSPNMYNLKTKLLVNGILIDTYTTPFGIRSIELNIDKGFLLNGEPIKFKGLSNHHDAGPVGAAVPDDLLYSRLKLLKDMGCNALRTTHNPFSPEFYALCDTLGIMVMDEAFDGWFTKKAEYDYGIYFKEWWKRDLKDFVKRDRNHPSVVMWSVGNEVRGFKAEDQKEIVSYLKTIDSSRPVTQGRGHFAPYVDITGFNGHGEQKGVLEKFHKENPDKLIIGTEMTHTLQTRGVYRTKTWYRTKDNPAPWEKPADFKRFESKVYKIPDLTEKEVFPGITKKYQSSYDNSIVRIGVRDDWNRVEALDYYVGNFRWTGFDYLGESFGWPARTANFGIIDLAGFPKDHYYLYQSLWSDKPMVHMLPHWTHPGYEGVEIPVVVYTNCESAELFLNGKSLGEKNITSERQIVWQVPYKSGELKVVAKNNSKPVVEQIYNSAEIGTKVQLKADKVTVKPNKTDVIQIEVAIVDSKNVIVPEGDNFVEFEISGPAKLLGVENGDILDLAPHKVMSRKAFKGKCLLLIQSTDEGGEIEVKASSQGLQESVLSVLSK
ncbi:sugar-binding domain-containing protein [Urechidicola vernalis]|uniref:Glycoside hydrolase family 2 TIM barrel-domain containing protein n=1 Tax=Urechidicola vernalis TaxID=3075600 RepID=A0ABU2Y0Z0_9FLAO|nr:sugar-binding domain-containing protein [Urechidicola sp. P050]MDT0551839.1 glycoside hydrolase family 2 TIM barrel-domain containing protein [Urechidicola sp. P050]